MKNNKKNKKIYLILVVLLHSVFILGCGQQEKEEKDRHNHGRPRWTSFPVEIYIESKLANKAEAEADILAAMDFWEKKMSRKLFHYKGVWTGGDAPLVNGVVNPMTAPVNQALYQNPWPYSSQILALNMRVESGSTIQRSIITINEMQSLCFGECNPPANTQISFRKVLSHEMGHFLGLNHSNEQNNIMYTFYNPNIPLEEMKVDWAELTAVIR